MLLKNEQSLLKNPLHERWKPLPYQIIYIQTPEQLIHFEKFISGEKLNRLFIDTETTGLDPFTSNLILVQILAGTTGFLINVPKITGTGTQTTSWRNIQRILEDKAILKIGHNLKFDLKFLGQLLSTNHLGFVNFFDTYLAEELLLAGKGLKGSSSLQSLAKKYLNLELDKTEQTSFKNGELSTNQLAYAAKDVTVLGPIYERQSETLLKAGLSRIAEIEFSIIPAIAKIELAGIRIDLQRLKELKEKYIGRLQNLEQELDELILKACIPGQLSMFGPKINYNSAGQIKKTLYAFGFKVDNTDTETLEKIPHPFTQKLIQHRKASKLLSSFIEKLPQHVHPCTGRIHAEFFQLGTEAGRFTCENPNLQQIPKKQEWRDLFIAEECYKILTADYSQIELRILAEYSQDPAFLEAFQKREDLHTRTAAQMYRVPLSSVTKDQRNVAKTINFGRGLSDWPTGSIYLKQKQKNSSTSTSRNTQR